MRLALTQQDILSHTLHMSSPILSHNQSWNCSAENRSPTDKNDFFFKTKNKKKNFKCRSGPRLLISRLPLLPPRGQEGWHAFEQEQNLRGGIENFFILLSVSSSNVGANVPVNPPPPKNSVPAKRVTLYNRCNLINSPPTHNQRNRHHRV